MPEQEDFPENKDNGFDFITIDLKYCFGENYILLLRYDGRFDSDPRQNHHLQSRRCVGRWRGLEH